MMAAKPRRVTGLQRQVYHLYKRSLQLIATKPEHTRPSWHLFIHHQFRHPTLGGGLRRKDVGAIEYLIRRGDKMLQGYQGAGTTNVSGVPVEPGPDRDEYAAGGQLGWIAKGGKHGSWRRTSNQTLPQTAPSVNNDAPSPGTPPIEARQTPTLDQKPTL